MLHRNFAMQQVSETQNTVFSSEGVVLFRKAGYASVAWLLTSS
jgi:hypothetical protein